MTDLENTNPPDAPCALCGGIAEGWAYIGDLRYCHPDDGPSCYEAVGDLATLRRWFEDLHAPTGDDRATELMATINSSLSREAFAKILATHLSTELARMGAPQVSLASLQVSVRPLVAAILGSES